MDSGGGGGSGAGIGSDSDHGEHLVGVRRGGMAADHQGNKNDNNLGARKKNDSSGLNPDRQRGFQPSARVTTTTLNDMRAKEGALVSRFMTFHYRKNTFVFDLYEKVFFTTKPTGDKIADFIYNDVCKDAKLRSEIVDVQIHPVKMLLFVKFKTEHARDHVNERVQSPEGISWTSYGVRVRGYSLEAQVKRMVLLGASPETTSEEIKSSFAEAGIGEIVEIRKGFLDFKRFPGVTDGSWALRVKLTDPDKEIPSYLHRRDEGELWSLNYDGKRFVCWKCGSSMHIGDRCNNQGRTFDEIFNGSVTDETFSKPTWAAVVRSGTSVSEEI